MKKVRIICRSSRLSLLQAELVKQKILLAQPGFEVEVIGRSSRGDKELHVNLSALDGTDFFTEEIFSALESKDADIAVHSLKDMSADHFFSHDAFAVVDRDDTRDVAIFNPAIVDKIKQGKTVTIGTCSPRREEMAVNFLKKALPQVHREIKIITKSIRGNVESRLMQLHNKAYDGTILATAGLNRLLQSEKDSISIKELLANKRLMLLPLIECVPAPCQGAIVAEAYPGNHKAVALLRLINDKDLFVESFNEKKEAHRYGTGCLQRFGVTTIRTEYNESIYASGIGQNDNAFKEWVSLPKIDNDGLNIFSSTEKMKDFFYCEWRDKKLSIDQPVVFMANYKILGSQSLVDDLSSKRIFVAGTKTWFELAKQGYWVEGCADALGFEWFLPAMQMPLLNIPKEAICILTHEEAASRWKKKGYNAESNYKLVSAKNKILAEAIAAADFIFWSSFSQFFYYGQFANEMAIHACSGGETASLLKAQGVEPVIFPTIKSFEQWKRTSFRLHSAG